MSKLRLFREVTPWIDRARAYRILIDGEARGKIMQGQTIELELSPGEHELRLKIDWAGSPAVIVSGDHDADMRCRANARPGLLLLFITFWRNRYIALWPG